MSVKFSPAEIKAMKTEVGVLGALFRHHNALANKAKEQRDEEGYNHHIARAVYLWGQVEQVQKLAG